MASTLQPPRGFIDLATAYTSANATFMDIIGVVVDVMPPTTTRVGQHLATFKLLDRSLYHSIEGSEGLTVRFFKNDPEQLPRVKKIGDVVLVRAAKMLSQQEKHFVISNYQTQCTVFPADKIPSPGFEITYQGGSKRSMIEALGSPADVARLNLIEQNYVIGLKDDMKAALASFQQRQAEMVVREEPRRQNAHEAEPPAKKQRYSGSFSAKFKIIAELMAPGFADLCGEVVKRIPVPQYGGCDLYITDYTENPLLKLYSPPESALHDDDREGDAFGYSVAQPKKPWPGPYGQKTMKINVKPPHARVANQIFEEGDFVLLQNVKLRTTAAGPWLEGDMWPDYQDQQKVKLRKIENLDLQEIRDINSRKEEYWKTRNNMLAVKQKIEETGGGKQKKGKKKNNKKQKKQTSDGQALSGGEDAAPNRTDLKSDTNPNVRCSHEEVPVSKIRDILDPDHKRHTNSGPDRREYILPFISAKYRARVRVVDFEPKALEDFAVEPLNEQDDDDSMAWQSDGTPRSEWYFSLLLEDAMKGSTNGKEHNRIWVHVHHEQAQFLFGNSMPDPADLRQSKRLLHLLTEKMFLLWGDLAEKKDGEEPSNRPFECCIQEYGIEMDEDDPAKGAAVLGWQRMYSMFGVTIL